MKKNLNLPLYWKCQLIGWSVASLYWSIDGWTSTGFRWDLALLYFFSDVLLYTSLTHLYRNFALANNWQDLPLNLLSKRLLFAIPLMGLLYTLVTIPKLYFIKILFSTQSYSLNEFAAHNGLAIFIAGLRLMAVWLLAYHLYHYARREIRLSAENTRLELSFKQAQLNNLSAQLNPHFLFNALNTIKSLTFSNQDAAGRGIDLLSELLRSSLNQGQHQLIKLKEEIELVRDYLELESLRLEERLRYELDFDLSLAGKTLPKLMIQLLVENAVKHGIAPSAEGGLISISVQEENGYINISVSNPGTIKHPDPRAGIGLTNLQERLRINYNNTASFSIREESGKVKAVIQIAIK